MNKTHNPKLKSNAQTLRKNMTKEEKHLWYDCLEKLPITVNRQKVIGNYIVDFYCAAASTVIEVDGYQHYLSEGLERDQHRDEFFRSLGISVLRYSNKEIHDNFKGVCEDIYNHLSPFIKDE